MSQDGRAEISLDEENGLPLVCEYEVKCSYITKLNLVNNKEKVYTCVHY